MARDGGLVAVRADRMVDVEAGEVRAGWVVLVRGSGSRPCSTRTGPCPRARPWSSCPATRCSRG
jgi:hypothetical protein